MGKVCIEVKNCDDCPYCKTSLIGWHCRKLNLSGALDDLYKVCPLKELESEDEIKKLMDENNSFIWFLICCVLLILLELSMCGVI